jgi:hypothetical protein
MRRLIRGAAALALAAMPLIAAVAAAQPDTTTGGADTAATPGSVHILADNGVIDSRN